MEARRTLAYPAFSERPSTISTPDGGKMDNPMTSGGHIGNWALRTPTSANLTTSGGTKSNQPSNPVVTSEPRSATTKSEPMREPGQSVGLESARPLGTSTPDTGTKVRSIEALTSGGTKKAPTVATSAPGGRTMARGNPNSTPGAGTTVRANGNLTPSGGAKNQPAPRGPTNANSISSGENNNVGSKRLTIRSRPGNAGIRSASANSVPQLKPDQLLFFESAETSKKKLIIRLPALAEQTTNIPKVLVELLSRSVLHWRERDTIMAHASDYDRTIEICKLIMPKGRQGFEHFIAALHISGNSLIAEVLSEPLTPAEEAQSFEECLLALDITRSPKIGSALLEIESFNVTLATTNEFHFLLNGTPGFLSMSEILTEYTVVNSAGKVLFFLIWRPADTGIQVANMRLISICELCCPAKVGVTRVCQNLIGNTIIELNTEWGSKDIRVGGDYIGFVRTSLFGADKVMNRFGTRVARVVRWGSNWYRILNDYGCMLAEFGNVPQYDEEGGQQVHARSGKQQQRLRFKLFEADWLSPSDRVLLLGAAIMILDLRVQGRAWTPAKLWLLYTFGVATAIATITLIILGVNGIL